MRNRVNPDHKCLMDRGWVKAETVQIGNRVQQRWRHEREAGRTYNTADAQYNQMQWEKRNAQFTESN